MKPAIEKTANYGWDKESFQRYLRFWNKTSDGKVKDKGCYLMEYRNSDRVQFYQLGTDKNIQPIWVFGHHEGSDSILGLLLDLSRDGAKVLTNKSRILDGESYHLFVQSSDTGNEELLKMKVRHCWSKPEGTLYLLNGFEFDEKILMKKIVSINDSDAEWFRCELVPL